MGLFGSLIKVALDVVEIPVAVVKDVATLGGTLTDQPQSYLEKKLDEIDEDYDTMKDKLSDD